MPVSYGDCYAAIDKIEDERRKRLKTDRIESKWELFSTKEAARRLGITPATLRRLVRLRKIGVFRVGGKLMFNQWVLEMYLWSIHEPQMAGGTYHR